jgi:hypothetical protein
MKRICRYLALRLSLIACFVVVGQGQEQPRHQHVGRVQDWSYHHVTMSGRFSSADLDKARVEPRILYRLAERNLSSATGDARPFGPDRRAPGRPFRPQTTGLKIDWSINLGAGIVASNMFPAKYSFDINAAASCSGDYVVYGLNVAGVTNGQANLVGVKNLYSGTGGLCGANPTVNWAYNGSTAGGSVLTSPVISLDGTKIAYIESAASSSIFHVLTWKAGEGTSATASKAPTLPANCASGTSCLKSVTYSARSSNTLASGWITKRTRRLWPATTARFTASVASSHAVSTLNRP